MPDLYDEQIARLRAIKSPVAFLDNINHEWCDGLGLFAFVRPPRYEPVLGSTCGCLTLVRGGRGYTAYDKTGAPDEALAAAIRADKRIPADVDDITPESLDAFAEWQRKLDILYGTKPKDRAFLGEEEEPCDQSSLATT